MTSLERRVCCFQYCCVTQVIHNVNIQQGAKLSHNLLVRSVDQSSAFAMTSTRRLSLSYDSTRE